MVDISPENRRAGHDFDGVSFTQKEIKKENTINLAKVFFYMFVLLLITAVVAFVVGYIFASWMIKDITGASGALYVAIISCSIFQVIITIIMSFCLNKSKGSMLFLSIFYALTMGVTLSTFVLFLPFEVLGISFLITALMFGFMTLIATLTKSSLNGLAIAGYGLLLGSFILLGINFLMQFLLPSVWNALCWIISFAVFAAIMFITIFDIWQIKKICRNANPNSNIALWCAFRLYVDFIMIFIRVLYFVGIAYSRKK